MRRLPGRAIACCIFAACFTRRVFVSPLSERLPSIRRMCPNHEYLHLRIARTRSYDLVRGLASSCADLCVMCDRHVALVPLSFARVSVVRFHASEP